MSQPLLITGASGSSSASQSHFALMMSTGFATVAASTTNMFRVSGSATASSDVNARMQIPFACTVKNLRVETSGTQPASGQLTLTLLVNGVANNVLIVTVPANTASGIFVDLTHSVSLNAGDKISWVAVNSATAASTAIMNVSAEVVV